MSDVGKPGLGRILFGTGVILATGFGFGAAMVHLLGAGG